MAYQSLYRRYRPRRFAEVRGQEHVVKALRNAVRDGRVGHAYLFSGPRGTGKTTTARILAKALNCENLHEGEPCCECESCLAIEAGTSYDLQELDAASNNGVEAMRDLISKAALGSPGRNKVYILDEVHMLSTAASNALLKTLEEPPSHVTFVLATTDPHKVLPTIRSRTQHFELNLLPADELAELVQWVIHDAELDVSPEAVEHVLRVGGGSARDTLSALDQAVAAGGVEDHAESVDQLVDALCANDVGLALRAVSDAVAIGRDPRVLGEELLSSMRDVFLSRMGGNLSHLTEGDRVRTEARAQRFTDRGVTRVLQLVGEALLEMRQAPDPRIPLEVALVQLANAGSDVSVDGLVARIEQLERTIAAGGVVAAVAPAATATPTPASPASAPVAAPSPPPADSSPAPAAAATPADGEPRGSGSGGRADEVRAMLAARGGSSAPPAPIGPASAPAPSAPSSAPPAPPRSTAPPAPSAPNRPAEPAPAAAPSAAVAPEAPAPPQPSAAEPAPLVAATASPGGTPTRDELTLAWADHILPKLGGRAKALFAAGRFVSADAKGAVFALPNAPHREHCEAKRDEVETVLSAHFGRPVNLLLVVDTDDRPAEPATGPAGQGGPAAAAPATAAVAEPDPEDEPFDVHNLEDASEAPTAGVDKLAQAFPGAELIEGS